MRSHREGITLESDSGLILKFDDRASKLITGRGGFGMPPVENRTRRAPYQHGETFINFRVRPRIINLPFAFLACTRQKLYELRRDILREIDPFGGAIKLYFAHPNDTLYYLNVYYHSGVTLATSGQPGPLVQLDGLQLIAYDPFWYENETNEIVYCAPDFCYKTFRFDPSGDPASVEWSMPPIVGTDGGFRFGGSTAIDVTIELINSGDALVYPTITIDGQYEFPRIENLETGDYFYWDNIIATDSEMVMIGEQRQLLHDDVVIQKPYGSSWIAILSEIEGVAGGINRIQITGRQRDSSTGITFEWRNKFIGL